MVLEPSFLAPALIHSPSFPFPLQTHTNQASPARIDRASWRKSAQWFSLIRPHVEVVLHDHDVFVAFQEHCLSRWDTDLSRRRECYSDEHYLATLLHIKGLDEETVRFEGVCDRLLLVIYLYKVWWLLSCGCT